MQTGGDDRTPGEPARGSVQPIPPAARPQPRGLVPMGRRSLRQSPERGPTRVPLGRLRRLSLVPRDGARVLRGRDDREAPERAVRRDQGGPRGAARRGRDLHGRRPGDVRERRMADVGLPHARGQAVLRRHVFPGRATPRAAVVPTGARGDRRRVDDEARRGGGPERPGDRVDPARRRLGSLRRAAHRRRRGRGLPDPPPLVRPTVGRLRRRAEVPATDDARVRAPAGDP